MKLRQQLYPIKVFHRKNSINDKPEDKLNFNLKKINYNPIFLGRARYGIYLAIKNSIYNTGKKRVLMSPYTIMDLINCVLHAGAEVEFFDANDDLKIFYPSLSFFEKKLSSKKFSTVLITHYHLNYQYIPQLKKICKKYNVELIEDCAISFGSNYPNSKIKIGQLSDYSLFSNSLFKFSNYLWGGFLHVKNNSNYKTILNSNYQSGTLKLFDYRKQIYKYLKFKVLSNKLIVRYFIFNLLRLDSIFNFKFFNQFLKNDPYVIFKKKFDKTYKLHPHRNYFIEMNRKSNTVAEFRNHRKNIFLTYNKILSKLLINYSYHKKFEGGFINYPILLGSPNEKIIIKKELLKRGYDIADQQYRNCSTIIGYTALGKKCKNVSLFIDRVLFLPCHLGIEKKDALLISKIVFNMVNLK